MSEHADAAAVAADHACRCLAMRRIENADPRATGIEHQWQVVDVTDPRCVCRLCGYHFRRPVTLACVTAVVVAVHDAVIRRNRWIRKNDVVVECPAESGAMACLSQILGTVPTLNLYDQGSHCRPSSMRTIRRLAALKSVPDRSRLKINPDGRVQPSLHWNNRSQTG